MAYCALEGEGESDNPRAFTVAPPWKRFLILAAGSTANLLLGLLIVLMMYAPVKTYATTTITGFAQGCPAQGEE
jgi:membrane-associated protease RseP (regulator of RpoE activity)